MSGGYSRAPLEFFSCLNLQSNIVRCGSIHTFLIEEGLLTKNFSANLSHINLANALCHCEHAM